MADKYTNLDAPAGSGGGGSGTVTSVNSVLPDGSGNVAIPVGEDNNLPSWLPETSYVANQQAVNDEKLYIAKVDFTSLLVFDVANWTEVGTGGGGPVDIPDAPAKQASTVKYELQTGVEPVAGMAATLTVSFPSLGNNDFAFTDINNGSTVSDLLINSGTDDITRIRFFGGGTGLAQQATFRLKIASAPGPGTATDVATLLTNWCTEFNTIPIVGETAVDVGTASINRNYTAARNGNDVVFTRNVVEGVTAQTWQIVAQNNWISDTSISNTNGVNAVIALDNTWEEVSSSGGGYENTFTNTPDLLTKVALFLGTPGERVGNADEQLIYDPFTTDGVTYYFFPFRDSGKGQWSNNTNPVDAMAVTWNLIG